MGRAHFNRPALEAIQRDCLDLGARKSHDYGQAGDAIAMAGLRGVVTRMLDKQMRLLSLTEPGFEMKIQDETVRDTLMDMVNYATYALAVLDGTWGVDPKERSHSEAEIKAWQEAAAYLSSPLNSICADSKLHKSLEGGAFPELPF